jgi:hypothetical protein
LLENNSPATFKSKWINQMTQLNPKELTFENLIIGLLLVGLTSLSIMSIYDHGPATDGLDGSFISALGYAFKYHFKMGIDNISTFGVLGYFYHIHSPYDGDLVYVYVIWQLLISLILAVFLVTRVYLLEGKLERILYLFALLIFTSTAPLPGGESLFMLSITIAALLAITSLPSITFFRQHLLGFLLLFLASLSLAKFTYFVSIAVSILTIAIAVWHSHSLKHAILVILTFLVFQLGIWVATGQSLLNFPIFLINSLQITSGYNEAMQSSAGNVAELKLAAAIFLAMMGMLVLSCFTWPIRVPNLMIAGMVLFSLFIVWKAGFVRHDVHSITFFGFTSLIPFFLEYQSQLSKIYILMFRTLRYIVVFASLVGLFSSAGAVNYLPSNFLAKWNETVVKNAETLVNFKKAKANWDNVVASVKQQYELPQTRAQVGWATVDIFSWEQGVLFLNGFNWKPRPVFQSYVAYTPKLLAINGDFYQSPRAPEFVLFKLQTIDERFPLMDDTEAVKVILRDYRPVLTEKGYLLLKHEPRSQPIAGNILLNQSIPIGTPIDISPFSDRQLLLSLDIRKSLAGRVYSLLYKLPPVYLEIGTTDGAKMSYRIVPNMVQSGILINPLILSQTDLVGWYTGQPLRRVANLRVVIGTEGTKWFEDNVVLTLNEHQTVPAKNLTSDELAKKLTHSMFYSFPYQETSVIPIKEVKENGQSVLMVHAPGELRFAVNSGTHRLTCEFGLLSEAYLIQTNTPTDGVEFSASLLESGQETVLFRRFLQPVQETNDRGMQSCGNLAFAVKTQGDLVLRTHPGPTNNRNYDWSFWRAVKID